MKTLYAVPWVNEETVINSKKTTTPEGFKVFSNLRSCILTTKRDSDNGVYQDGLVNDTYTVIGYTGPKRPLHYYVFSSDMKGRFPQFVETIDDMSNLVYIK